MCDRHDADFYPRFKKWCDEYFFLPHRGETRGVGGIFFDQLQRDPARDFAFVRDAGDAFLEAYLPIVSAGASSMAGASASGSFSCCAAAATSSSTCSTIAARTSGSRPTAAPSRS